MPSLVQRLATALTAGSLGVAALAGWLAGQQDGEAMTGFDPAWAGIVLVCCASLVATAVMVGHHWQTTERAPDASAPRGIDLVGDAYVAMAQQVVEGLERRQLVPTGHGERTAALATRLGESLRMTRPELRELATAARLLDLGKGWVRAPILQKRGELTAAELESLRHHPLRAAELLARVPSLRGVARLVRHQLERHDGSGWPDGLRGSRIPLGSRILAIASAFDRLTHGHGDAELGWQSALEHLQRARGEVFDPELLQRFTETVRSSPPAAAGDRDVLIVPGGVLPWRELGRVEDDRDDEEPFDDLEVLLDDGPRQRFS